MPNPSSAMKHCIEKCRDCHDVCVQTVVHCLEKGGRHAEAPRVRLLLDCAQICNTSEDFLLRGSDLHELTCGVASEICARCAEECERLGDDPTMRHCAETCRRCAASCAQMAGAPQMAGAGSR
jgi:hypothetical protein